MGSVAMIDRNDLVRLGASLVRLGLDYIRWTQLAPMLLGWFLAFAFIVQILFPEQLQFVVDGVQHRLYHTFLVPIAWLYSMGPELVAMLDYHANALETRLGYSTMEQVVVILGWTALAAISWVFFACTRAVWVHHMGDAPLLPRFRQRLIVLAGALVGYLIIARIGLSVADPTRLGDPSDASTVLLVMAPLLLLAVSLWGLSISALIGWLHNHLDEAVAKQSANR